jgi:hypothetical protein
MLREECRFFIIKLTDSEIRILAPRSFGNPKILVLIAGIDTLLNSFETTSASKF